jgi:hypothetical protein
MRKLRNRLLILLAVLTIGMLPIARAAHAWQWMTDPGSGTSSITGPYSGEPDTPNSKTTTTTHGASSMLPSDQGGTGTTTVVVSRASWLSTVIRIWAATRFGVGQ